MKHCMSTGNVFTASRGFGLISSLFIGLAACSGGTGNGGGGTDAGGTDAGGADSGGEVCAVADNFADIGAGDGNAFSASQYLTVDVELAASPVDLFVVELFEGVAPFENGLVTGTFDISGDLTSYNTCGACVTVWANVENGSAEMVYVAQAGTLEITSVTGDFIGSFTPSAATSTFVGYKPTSDTSSVEVPQCTIQGGSVSWDAQIETD